QPRRPAPAGRGARPGVDERDLPQRRPGGQRAAAGRRPSHDGPRHAPVPPGRGTMSELTLNVIRLGLLALLWAFVFSVVGAMRADLYGTRVMTRAGGRREVRPARPARGRRGGPSHLAVVAGSLRGTTVPLHDGGLLIGRN